MRVALKNLSSQLRLGRTKLLNLDVSADTATFQRVERSLERLLLLVPLLRSHVAATSGHPRFILRRQRDSIVLYQC